MSFCLLACLSLPALSAQKWTRFEAQYTPEVHGVDCSATAVVAKMYPEMGEKQQWFVAAEIDYLNEDYDTLVVPVYQLYPGGKKVCSDLRNWHVAVHKGYKYGVHPAFMIAVRTHENPQRQRDWYAYGVKAVRGSDLWTQGEWAGRIIYRIASRQGWDPWHPTQYRMWRLATVYAPSSDGNNPRHWAASVWTIFKRCFPVN